jgi:hypothetical protein
MTYEAVRVPSDRIFTIDPKGNLKVNSTARFFVALCTSISLRVSASQCRHQVVIVHGAPQPCRPLFCPCGKRQLSCLDA